MSLTIFFTFSLIRVIFGEAQNHSDLDFSKVSMEFEIFFFSVGRNLAPEPEFFGWFVSMVVVKKIF